MQTEIKVEDFSSRGDLEEHVTSQHGRSVDDVDDVTIVGTVADLKKKFLRHGAKVWGVLVKATDYTAPEKIVSVPRGKKVESSLNGTKVSIKKKKSK